MPDWSHIVEQHGPMVWRTAYRLLTHEADAADCFQRTFLSALELERKQTVRNWPALLKRLATARALDTMRLRYRETNRLTNLADGSFIDRNEVGPAKAAEASELAKHLREALAALDPRQAQVFCLACLDELSYQEIADQLRLSVNHVGVLLNRARATLRDLLAAYRPAAQHFPQERMS